MTVSLPQSCGRLTVLFTDHIISHLPFSDLCDKMVLHQQLNRSAFLEKTTKLCYSVRNQRDTPRSRAATCFPANRPVFRAKDDVFPQR